MSLGGYAILALFLYTGSIPHHLVAPLVVVVVGWGLFTPLLVMTYRGQLAPWAARTAVLWFWSGMALQFLMLPDLARFRVFGVTALVLCPLLFSSWWPEAQRHRDEEEIRADRPPLPVSPVNHYPWDA